MPLLGPAGRRWPSVAALSPAPCVTPQTRPTNPLTAPDVAAALVDLGLAASYDAARQDVEAARAEVSAGRVVPSADR